MLLSHIQNVFCVSGRWNTVTKQESERKNVNNRARKWWILPFYHKSDLSCEIMHIPEMLSKLCIGRIIMVFLFYRHSLCWCARVSNACSTWFIFMKACIGRRSTGAAQHEARVFACCSWTNYRWCIDGTVNTRLWTAAVLSRRFWVREAPFWGSAELYLTIHRVFSIESLIISHWFGLEIVAMNKIYEDSIFNIYFILRLWWK